MSDKPEITRRFVANRESQQGTGNLAGLEFGQDKRNILTKQQSSIPENSSGEQKAAMVSLNRPLRPFTAPQIKIVGPMDLSRKL